MGSAMSTSFVWANRHNSYPSEEREDRYDDENSGNGSSGAHRLEVGATHALDLPCRATTEAAGFDVCASEQTVIAPRSREMVGTGLKLAMPSKVYSEDRQVVMFATLKGRSGLAKRGIDIHTGTIDCDYRGELKVIVINNTDREFEVHAGDRIAQLIFGMALVPDLVSLDDVSAAHPTQRGNGGFGSTGVEALNAAVQVAIEGADAGVIEAHMVEPDVTTEEVSGSRTGLEAA